MAGIGRIDGWITLPNGQRVQVHEVNVDSLYSCLIIDASTGGPEWRLFEYGLSQEVPSTNPAILATRAHTNVPRAGYMGLPMGWEHFVRYWRASTNIRFAEPILYWAAETSVELRYMDKTIRSTPLLDLLMAPQPFIQEVVDPPEPMFGLWMRENVNYSVRVSCRLDELDKLQRFLVENTNDQRLLLWIWLEGVTRKAIQ